MDPPAPQPPPLRPLGVGEMLDVAIRIYRAHFATLVRVVAFAVVPVQVLAFVVNLSAAPDERAPLFDTSGEFGAGGDEFWVSLAGAVVVGLVSFLATSFATGTSTKAVADAYLGRPVDGVASLRHAAAGLWRVAGVSIVAFALSFAGLFLCIAPGVWLYVSWTVAVPVVLLEGSGVGRALGRSFRLVRGRWWAAFGLVAVGQLLSGIVGTALALPLVGIVLTPAGDSDVVRLLGQAVANTAASVLTTPFVAATLVVLYFDLRVRKEGLDVQLLAEGLGPAPEPGPPDGWAPPGGWDPPTERPRPWSGAPPPETPEDEGPAA